jgi:hypothetical protein
MPVPKSGTSVFSLGVGVEKIRRCNAELMRWMVLWEVQCGQRPRQWGDRGLGDCRGQAFPLAGTTRGSATAAFIKRASPVR